MSGWLGVVSAEHVRRGVALSIAQIGHGGRGGVARMQAGDTLIYYSPVERLGEKTRLQQFTALGTVADDEIWQADDGEFTPFRRRVNYIQATPVGLAEVRTRLHLTAQPNWGYQLRLGIVPLEERDVAVLRAAMTA
ncbi:MAG: EVE domain-containing protein [Specibacter sp.]